tara:strand:- start:157 stop:735 length:579 start_codon:yes stop_codon:yes gene_type:complete
MKFLSYKGLIIFPAILLVFFIIYSKFLERKEASKIDTLEKIEESFTNSNIIKDIRYSSKDIKGNEYTILAKQGEIDLNNSEIIFLKEVKAYINLVEKDELITIVSDFGKYNTVSYDTIFSQNVNIQYLDNQITSNYLDFSLIKNILIISKNVVYTNPTNILKADVIELDTITKDTKIFMYNSKDQVNIESRN